MLAALPLLAGCAAARIGAAHPEGCARIGVVTGASSSRARSTAVSGALSDLARAAARRGANYVELMFQTDAHDSWWARTNASSGGIAYHCEDLPPEAPPVR